MNRSCKTKLLITAQITALKKEKENKFTALKCLVDHTCLHTSPIVEQVAEKSH